MSSSDASTPRFTAQATSPEDLLKSQTVGLVQLDEFRKRRKDVEESKTQAAGDKGDRTINNDNDDTQTALAPLKRKTKRKLGGKSLLSFGGEDDADEGKHDAGFSQKRTKSSSSSETAANGPDASVPRSKRKLNANSNSKLPAPKVITKAALVAEAVERERLRKEFVLMQEKVRDTEIAIPFVFYDGSNTPGGTVKIKKGSHVWLFLERCRKLGAEMGVGAEASDGTGAKARIESKKSWARIGVDDLLCVRGNIIIPHHYELYYFIANRVADPSNPNRLLFDYTGTSEQISAPTIMEEQSLLKKPSDDKLEGDADDPIYTKVVDRRWYEKNKHIYPVSLWKEYKAGKEFEDSAKGKRDAQGNSFFFS